MAIPKLNDKGRMADIPPSPEVKVTAERRGEIVLIGVDRPQIYNRFDPDAFFAPAKAYYDFDNDPRGVIQEIAPSPAQALEAGIGLARKIAACGPLGIKTTLEAAHLSIEESEAAAFAKLGERFGGLFHTEDFIEGRTAEAEGRPPAYQGR